MIDEDTARAIAQATIDAINKRHLSDLPRASGLITAICRVWYIASRPLHHLRLQIERQRYPNDKLVLVDRITREEDFGWVFFYESERFLLTGNDAWSLLGNAPLIVDRCDGSVHVTGTSKPVEFFIEKYKKERTLRCG